MEKKYVAETPAPAVEAPAAAPVAAPAAEAPAPELELLAVLEGALPSDAAAAAEAKLVAAGFDSPTSLAVLTLADLQLAGVPTGKDDEIMVRAEFGRWLYTGDQGKVNKKPGHKIPCLV